MGHLPRCRHSPSLIRGRPWRLGCYSGTGTGRGGGTWYLGTWVGRSMTRGEAVAPAYSPRIKPLVATLAGGPSQAGGVTECLFHVGMGETEAMFAAPYPTTRLFGGAGMVAWMPVVKLEVGPMIRGVPGSSGLCSGPWSKRSSGLRRCRLRHGCTCATWKREGEILQAEAGLRCWS